MWTLSKRLQNLLNSREYQLSKIVAIIPKENIGFIAMESKKSRKYLGPMKFPVTPGRKENDLKMTISSNSQKTHLSLHTNEADTLNI